MAGRKRTKKGYIQVHRPNHPRSDSNGYVMEHIVVFEDYIGFSIPKNCVIHHLNGDKSDNRIENLCMMEYGAHTAFHHRGTKETAKTRKKISDAAKIRFSDKRNHPFYKDIDIDQMKKMRDSGETVANICKAFGICKGTFYRKMEEYNNA